jgi:6-phosphogluconolactonase (cycloisomerase 2 family)
MVVLTIALAFTFGCGGVSTGAGNKPAPNNTYAYLSVADNNGNTSITQFQVTSSGTLNPLTPATVLTNLDTFSIAVDPSGKYLFALNGGGTIQQFIIPDNGTLSANAIPTITTGNVPAGMAFTPNDQFAIVITGFEGEVISYSLSSAGALTLVSTAAAGNNPNSVVVDQSGRFAYVASNDGRTISGYSISANGMLTSLESINPSGCATGCIELTMSRAGDLYALSEVASSVTQFSIDAANGVLSTVNTYSTGPSTPASINFDPTGAYAYVITGNTLSLFDVDQTGGLVSNGFDMPTPFSPSPSVVDPSGKFLFLGNLGHTGTFTPQVSQYTINAGGTLAPNGATPLSANEYPFTMVFAQR